jgi:hypothetical protein
MYIHIVNLLYKHMSLVINTLRHNMYLDVGSSTNLRRRQSAV